MTFLNYIEWEVKVDLAVGGGCGGGNRHLQTGICDVRNKG